MFLNFISLVRITVSIKVERLHAVYLHASKVLSFQQLEDQSKAKPGQNNAPLETFNTFLQELLIRKVFLV